MFQHHLDDFQHRTGQIDGASGFLRMDINPKYNEGWNAGRYDYDKEHFGESFAKVAKTERDHISRVNEGNSSENRESSSSSSNYSSDSDYSSDYDEDSEEYDSGDELYAANRDDTGISREAPSVAPDCGDGSYYKPPRGSMGYEQPLLRCPADYRSKGSHKQESSSDLEEFIGFTGFVFATIIGLSILFGSGTSEKTSEIRPSVKIENLEKRTAESRVAVSVPSPVRRQYPVQKQYNSDFYNSRAVEEQLVGSLRTSRDPFIRRASAERLSGYNYLRVARALNQAIQKDPHPQVRASAARALGEVGNRDFLYSLQIYYSRDPSPVVRNESARAYNKIISRYPY